MKSERSIPRAVNPPRPCPCSSAHAVWNWAPRTEQAGLTASLVGFWLDLDSELVFVGDAGTTEPNAASERFGAELALFWRPTNWLTLDGSAAVTRARFR